MAVDRVAALLSMQRALWEQVTPNLRGVAVAVRSGPAAQAIEARLLYEGAVNERERECTSLAETHCLADFLADVAVSFHPVDNASLES